MLIVLRTLLVVMAVAGIVASCLFNLPLLAALWGGIFVLDVLRLAEAVEEAKR